MEVSDSSFWLEFLRGMLKPAAATAVVAMAVALSFMQRLGLEWEMVYSIARAFLQLSVIGFVLEFIFTQKNAGWIVLAYFFMVLVAGYTAGQRAKHVPRGNYIAGASILAGTSLTMLLLVVLRVFPFTPRYIIPVSGMMVGNAMTVTGVTMKKLREDLKIQKNLGHRTADAYVAKPSKATLPNLFCHRSYSNFFPNILILHFISKSGDSSRSWRNATAGDSSAGEEITHHRAIPSFRQCENSRPDLSSRRHDGAHHGRSFASRSDSAPDCCYEYAHWGLHCQQHYVDLSLLACLLHQSLSAGA